MIEVRNLAILDIHWVDSIQVNWNRIGQIEIDLFANCLSSILLSINPIKARKRNVTVWFHIQGKWFISQMFRDKIFFFLPPWPLLPHSHDLVRNLWKLSSLSTLFANTWLGFCSFRFFFIHSFPTQIVCCCYTFLYFTKRSAETMWDDSGMCCIILLRIHPSTFIVQQALNIFLTPEWISNLFGLYFECENRKRTAHYLYTCLRCVKHSVFIDYKNVYGGFKFCYSFFYFLS